MTVSAVTGTEEGIQNSGTTRMLQAKKISKSAQACRDRETVVKLNASAAAVLHKVPPEDLRKRVNDATGSRINLLGKAPRVIAAKQLKSRDVVLHTATMTEADTLKNTEDDWVKVLGTTAQVIKPTYRVIVHGVATGKDSIRSTLITNRELLRKLKQRMQGCMKARK